MTFQASGLRGAYDLPRIARDDVNRARPNGPAKKRTPRDRRAAVSWPKSALSHPRVHCINVYPNAPTERLVDPFGEPVGAGLPHGAVNIERNARLLVTDHPLHVINRGAEGDRASDRRVPQVVRTKLRQLRALRRRREDPAAQLCDQSPRTAARRVDPTASARTSRCGRRSTPTRSTAAGCPGLTRLRRAPMLRSISAASRRARNCPTDSANASPGRSPTVDMIRIIAPVLGRHLGDETGDFVILEVADRSSRPVAPRGAPCACGAGRALGGVRGQPALGDREGEHRREQLADLVARRRLRHRGEKVIDRLDVDAGDRGAADAGRHALPRGRVELERLG